MIGIVKFCNAVNDRAVIGTTGYDATLIEKVNQVQTQAVSLFASLYENNQAVKDALGPFIKTITKSTLATGELVKESDYVHFTAVLGAAEKTAYPINTNEVSIINSSPIRKPSIIKGNIFYHQKDDSIFFLPKQVMNVEYTYIRKPREAKLVLKPVSTVDSDYLVPSTTPGDIVDLEWPESMFNLLLYMTLEKLGMEMKEPILLEYANLGIQREMINTQPQ